jgi:hypothetical protein
VGQGASDGVGNGAIVSAGAGPSGDGPQGQAQSALSEAQCNAPEDDGATELSELVCEKLVWGMGCKARCQGEGVDCAAGRPHPKKSDGGFGLLSGCCACKGKQKCTYFYPNNGDSCTFDAPFLNMFATCVP